MTLLYAVPVAGDALRWLDDPRRSTAVEPGREYAGRHAVSRRRQRPAVAAIRWGPWPMPSRNGAWASIPACPAFFRIGYNAGTGELFLAYDSA